MLIRVSHQTVYRYAAPARGAIQLLRLTPRDHDGQHVRSWRIDVQPDARLRQSEDCFGNIVHMFNIDGPLETLTIGVEGEVDVWDASGVARGAAEPFPPMLFLRDAALTIASDGLKSLATQVAAEAGEDRLALLHRLMLGLNASVRFDVGGTDAATTAANAFASRRGVCQDFAHMFIAAARSLGIPARYVSGYLMRADGVAAQDAGHAWAEAFVSDLGWIGFDPANGVSPTDAYIRVAVGLDYLGAAPVRGARYGGGGEKLGVHLRVDAAPMQTQN